VRAGSGVPRWNGKRWQADYRTPEGRKSVYCSTPGKAGYRECAALLEAAILNARLGAPAPAQDMPALPVAVPVVPAVPAAFTSAEPGLTVGAWLDRWLAKWNPNLGVRSLVNYRSAVDNHIRPALGDLALDALTADHVNDLMISKAALSGSHRQIVYGILNRSMQKAVTLRLAPANPCALVDRPVRHRGEAKCWTEEETARFLASIRGHRMEAAFVIAVDLGLRQSEILGLRWGRDKDVDLAMGRLTVNGQLGKLTRVHEGRKGGAATMTRDIPPHIMALLEARADAQAEQKRRARRKWTGNPEGWVFTTATGRPVLQSHYWTMWKAAVERAGVSYIGPHGARHTFGASLVTAGFSDRQGGAALGHSPKDGGQTFGRVYAHQRDEQRAMDEVNAHIIERVRAREAAAR
jgi:integrase